MPKFPRRLVVKYFRKIDDNATLKDGTSSLAIVDSTADMCQIESESASGQDVTLPSTEIEKKDANHRTDKMRTDNVKSEQNDVKPNLKGDKLNVVFLILLCILQGVPIGIAMAIKTYMQNTHMSYFQQAKYSLVDLPYSFKILWAPLVDAAYIQRIGKRKTWMIPTQIAIGLMFIFVGSNINIWLMKDGSHMTTLTIVFFCVNTLISTQDIAIDGWALTLLRRENIGYASTCNTSGQAFGAAIGYALFILLESEQFCNNWLRFTKQNGGMVSMKGYLYFWGITYILITTCIAIFKKEKCDLPANNVNRVNVIQTYKQLWKIINLQTMKQFAIIMLLYEIIFSSMGSSVSNPKFMEYGMNKEDLVLVDMSLIPIKIIVPVFIAQHTIGPKPLKMFYNVVPFRLLLGISYGVLVYYTPYFIGTENHKSIYFFSIYEFHRICRLVLSVIMYLGVQSFFSRISDPQIGGTYMSLLNTLWYLGVAIARVAALGLLNSLTVKRCSTDKTNACWTKKSVEECKQYSAGECITLVDGYFVEVCICTVLGIVWYMFLNRILKSLQSKQLSDWKVDNGEPACKLEGTIGRLPDLVVTEIKKS